MKRILIVVILVCVAFQVKSFFRATHEPSMTVASDGALHFPWGGAQVVAEKGEDISGEYIVIGASLPQASVPGILAVLSRTEAERLTTLYGDYRRCLNPGADMAKSQVVHMMIITENPDMPHILQDIRELQAQLTETLIQIEGYKLTVKNFYIEHQGKNIEQPNFPHKDELFYISSVRITSKTPY